MSNNEMPQYVQSTYTGTAATNKGVVDWTNNSTSAGDFMVRGVMAPNFRPGKYAEVLINPQTKEAADMVVAAACSNEGEEAVSKRRLVIVLIVDPDERVPVEKSVLYRSDIFLTDETNEEIYFGLNMAQMLKDHNEKRADIEDEDKSTVEKPRFLKPARISDLSWTVVELATF